MNLILIEHDRGTLSESSLEAITFGRKLGSVEALIIGANGQGLVDQLGNYGLSKIHLLTHEKLTDYSPEAWSAAIEQIFPNLDTSVVVASGTEKGNEVMAYLAARLDLPLATNCLEIDHSEDPMKVTRIRWGGSLLEDASISGGTKLLTVVPHTIEVEPCEPSQIALQTHAVTLSDHHFRVSIVDRIQPESTKISLNDAKVIVSGGRGVGSAEGFSALEELADQLHAAVGCSRVVTNNGWRPHSDQVGQTGARVAPDLYIACGISGAIQHWVGCKGAKKILVINTDPDAPIVSKADYAIIGDLHQVLPAISRALK